MKKVTNFSMTALVIMAFILVGCVKEEQIENGNPNVNAKVIGIDALVSEGATSRAAVTDESLPIDSNFGLYGYKGTTLYKDAEPGDKRTVSNVKVNNSGIIQEGDIYWPTSNFTASGMKFYAYYPYQLSFSGPITSMSSSATGLTIGWTTPATADVDLMYASTDTPHTEVPSDGTSDLKFKHILSYFDVQAKIVDNTATGSGAPTIKVKSITVKCHVTGTYDGTDGLWDLTTSTVDTRTVTQETTLSKGTFKSVAEFLVLPQSYTSREVVVTYDFGSKLNQTLTILDENDNIPVFTIAKKNTLQITFTVKDTAVKISFGVTVTPWGTGTTSNVNKDHEV